MPLCAARPGLLEEGKGPGERAKGEAELKRLVQSLLQTASPSTPRPFIYTLDLKYPLCPGTHFRKVTGVYSEAAEALRALFGADHEFYAAPAERKGFRVPGRAVAFGASW